MERDDLLNIFEVEKECNYKDEHYSVRDNGAILRHSKEGKKSRKLDNKWTFGTPDSKTGYLIYGGERVHRIVATAFHGEPSNSEYVVDHIDTNRQNNRPANLRWLTRLENILFNDITRAKIEALTGLPIRAIFSNIAILQSYILPPNLSWMGTVSKEEADKALSSWDAWVNRNKYSPIQFTHPPKVKWVGFYPLYPSKIYPDAIIDYLHNLKAGVIFYESNIFTTKVIKAELSNNRYSIFVKGYTWN
ncbi:MAG: HNH endonuclease, partial [Bacteroidaceae bacterium]|nr:HNH endonuclease [Bacteroidaceae bacterium]